MASETVAMPGAVFCVWGKPEKADLDRLLEELRANAHAAGHPIVYVTRVPLDAPPPDDEVRRYLDGLMPAIVECCSTYHVVLEGSGFMAALKRGVLLSLFQIRWRKGTFFVHATTDDVARESTTAERPLINKLLEKARLAGLAAGPSPASLRVPAANAPPTV